MNFLYLSWGENSSANLINTLASLGHTVCTMQTTIQNYLYNPPLTQVLDKELTDASYDFIFSFDYIPVVSESAQRHGIKYISWVYDCPHWTLYSPTIANPYNYLFLFDRMLAKKVKALGAQHVYHMPLACDTVHLNKHLGIETKPTPDAYDHDITFVGSLYETNHYSQIQFLPDFLRGYLDGCMAAQKQFWGYDIIEELLTPDILSSLQSYIHLDPEPACPIPAHELFRNMILVKVSSDERIAYINTLAQLFPVSLYSGSNARLCPFAANKGTLSYMDQVPDVYFRSKINLNLTLRSIQSGIPLRALDIMGCGGFLLTNYQPELSEFFEPDQDFVYFENPKDLVQKTDYYLHHDKERMEIAQSGWKKVQEQFSYKKQLQKILDICVSV